MKRSIYRLVIIICLAVGVLLFISKTTYAESVSPQSYLPLTCDRSKGTYKPMTTLVVINLADSIALAPGMSTSEVAKSLYYDLAYVRGNNVAPFNAILHNDEIVYLSCEYPDYLANVVSANDTGYFILAVTGEYSTAEVQKIVNSLKLSKLQEAELVTVTDEKNTTLALANVKKCESICKSLKPNIEGLTKREYKVTVQEPNYSKSVRQKELVSFSVKVKNDGNFPIYSTGTESLYLASQSKGLSALYHSSWLAPSIIARIPGTLLPGEETAISVTLGAPLLPGKYKETLALKIGKMQIGKPMQLTFSVENDNYKLAKIVSRDDAAFVNLRQTPYMKGNVLMRLEIGAYVIVKGYQDAWVKIETKEGRVGWVYKPFIREM